MFASVFGSVDEAALVAEIEACTRAEAVTAARRLAAIGELAARADAPELDERQQWVVDLWACAAAEVGAAMGISQRKASGQMKIGLALRERLPKLAARFSAGEISAKLVSTISWRTHLVIDAELLARIDAAVAERATGWGALSEERLELAIDAIVETHDPDARRRFHEAARQCDVQVGKPDDATGTASVYGRLSATDAALLEQRLTEMIASVCAGDPRNEGQRRAAALGAMAAGADRLACHCGQAQCPRAGAADPRAAAFVIHAITDTTPANTDKAGLSRGARTNVDAETSTPDAPIQEAPARETEPVAGEPPAPPETEPAPAPQTRPVSGTNLWTPAAVPVNPGSAALIVGGGVIPPALLAELINNGAKVRSVYRPSDIADAGYRPSRPCERFVRMRDMTCRFPGCERRAEYCDVDHTVPYPGGPTHPSNTKCLCRFHHLLKTFCGWHDEQRPDGTIIWTAPSGRTYRTQPTSRLYFPHWDTTTADLPPPANSPPPSAQRALKMPRRRRTRAADNDARINAERKLNATTPRTYR
ncbi:MAG: HNH endonuclease [Actinomycetota bacterium]|nr:HNH endonuclease [Actinomycetota bacterium]